MGSEACNPKASWEILNGKEESPSFHHKERVTHRYLLPLSTLSDPSERKDTGLDHVLPPVFPTVRAKLVQVLVSSLICCVMLEKPLGLWTSLPKPVRIQPEDLLCT